MVAAAEGEETVAPVKILIVGHSRAGKDEVAWRLARHLGVRNGGAMSRHMAHHVAGVLGCLPSDAYRDRHQHRMRWRQIIDDYRREDPARILREMFQTAEVVCGVRARAEFEAGRKEGFFDLAVWIENPRVPPDPTLELTAEDCDRVLVNDGDLRILQSRITEAFVLQTAQGQR